MNQLGTKKLETKRLILRKIEQSDCNQMFSNWANSEAVTKYLCWPYHQSIETTEGFITYLTSNYSKSDFYQWGIKIKDENELVGMISVSQMNEEIATVEIGYCIGQAYWHKGFVSEAFKRIIAFFFDEVNVQVVRARHDKNNPHSGDVMKKCGLTYEGTLRKYDQNNQGIVDCVFYSILREEYNQAKQKEE